MLAPALSTSSTARAIRGRVQARFQFIHGPQVLAVDLLDHVAFPQASGGRLARRVDAGDDHALRVRGSSSCAAMSGVIGCTLIPKRPGCSPSSRSPRPSRAAACLPEGSSASVACTLRALPSRSTSSVTVVPGRVPAMVLRRALRVLDAAAVDGRHDVAALDAGLGGRAAGVDVAHERAAHVLEAKAGGEVGGDALDGDAELAAPHVAVLDRADP